MITFAVICGIGLLIGFFGLLYEHATRRHPFAGITYLGAPKPVRDERDEMDAATLGVPVERLGDSFGDLGSGRF